MAPPPASMPTAGRRELRNDTEWSRQSARAALGDQSCSGHPAPSLLDCCTCKQVRYQQSFKPTISNRIGAPYITSVQQTRGSRVTGNRVESASSLVDQMPLAAHSELCYLQQGSSSAGACGPSLAADRLQPPWPRGHTTRAARRRHRQVQQCSASVHLAVFAAPRRNPKT